MAHGGGGGHNEVKTRLTLDDEASEALHKIGESFEGVGERVHETSHELMGMAKQAVAFTIGFQLNGMIEGLHEFGHELIENALHLEDQKKELSGLLSITEKGETSMEELAAKTDELNEKFETLGMTTGNSKEQMVDAFETIASRSTRSTEAITGMVEKMAVASKRLPGGMQALSMGWRDLEMGVVRSRNSIVSLIRQTGVAKGSAADIAKGLNAMIQGGHQEDVYKLAEEAIDRMAKKMEGVPLTFGQTIESIKSMREALFESMGTPILKAIGPQLEKARQWLVAHREELVRLAETMGERVGEWVKQAGEMIQRGFEYLKDHADEILDALERGGKALKDAIAFMVEHKTLIMALAGAYYGQKGAGAVARALPQAGLVAGQLAGYGAKVAGSQSIAGMSVGGAGAGAAALGTFAIADAVIWSEVARQSQELEKESGLTMGQVVKHFFQIGGGIAEASDRIQNFHAEMDAWNKTMGDGAHHSMSELENLSNKVKEFGEAAVEAGDMEASAMEEIKRGMQKRLELERDHQNHLDTFAYDAQQLQFQKGGVQNFLGAVEDAFKISAEDDKNAAVESARKILDGNKTLREALAGTGADTEKALAALIAGRDTKDGAKLPAINFGPSTFQIKQDFRDVDPDRIAVVFRKDIAKHATSRVAARTGSPFGV